MNVLVTGASSAVGLAICRKFLSQGHTVFGTYFSNPPENDSKNINWIQIDLPSTDGFPKEFDTLVHCASAVPTTIKSDDDYTRINIEGARHLVKCAIDGECKNFVFLSSMSVYGNIQVPIIDEDTPPIDPDAYGRSKKVAENIFLNLANSTRKIFVIRLPGVVGPRSKNNFLSGTLEKVLKGEKIRLSNPDLPFNNMAHVDEVSDLIDHLLNRQPESVGVLNIASSGSMTIREIVRRMSEFCGKPFSPIIVPSSKKSFTISIERLIKFGFKPKPTDVLLEKFVRENFTSSTP